MWLGTSNPESRTAIKFLRKLNGILSNKRRAPVNRLLRSADKRATLLDLFQNDYWSRVWIVQEIDLAKQIWLLHGEDQFPWSYISNLIHSLELVDPRCLPKSAVRITASIPAKL